MHLSLSQERISFLEDNFFEFSFQEREPSRALFNTITDSNELHYLADIYNGDDGPEVLSWIIDSEYCDQATAALIFWRSQPDFYQEYANESEVDLQDGVLTLLQRIMHNWERGFYQRQKIAYDHSNDPAAGKLYESPTQKWAIPAYLLVPTPDGPSLPKA